MRRLSVVPVASRSNVDLFITDRSTPELWEVLVAASPTGDTALVEEFSNLGELVVSGSPSTTRNIESMRPRVILVLDVIWVTPQRGVLPRMGILHSMSQIS